MKTFGKSLTKRFAAVTVVALFGLVVGLARLADSFTARADNDKNIVVALVGTATGQTRAVPRIEGTGTTTALCFDLKLVNLVKDKIIGTATDCLADVTPVGSGLALTATTFFNFEEGTLVARGHTSVQPLVTGSSPFTHMTGAIPFPDTNQVLYGTGEFAGRTANVRLSGAVNLDNLSSKNEITFNCIFVIHLNS